MRTYKQKLEKIFKRIEKLSLRGNSNLFEYQKYIDELINKGQYAQFKDCLNYYYKIDVRRFVDVQEVRRQTWDLILFETNTSNQRKLNSLYKTEKVYQQGFEIFDLDTNVKLGEIKEIDNIDFTSKYEYSDPLYLDPEFATKLNIKRIFLEVYKGTEFLLVNSIDENIDEYRNQIERYKTALNFLKS